jgi:hypothetical protein
MKKIIVVVCCIFIGSLLKAQDSRVHVKGTVENASAGSKIFLRVSGIKVDSCSFLEKHFTLSSPIGSPVLGNLLFDSAGNGQEIKWTPLFLDTGWITIQIGRGKVNITGPALSVDYQEQLLGPVVNFNREIIVLQQKLKQAQQVGSADTVSLKSTLNANISKCFGVPRKYVSSHPGSILCIPALKMMGTGDPTAADPKGELKKLYDLLSIEIHESADGIRYGQWLGQLFK